MPRCAEFYTPNRRGVKPSPWGEGVTPYGVTDVGSIVFPGGPKEPTGSPPHPSRLAPCHPLQQERALLCITSFRRSVSLPACRGRWHRRCRRGCATLRSRGQRFQRKAFSLGLCPAQRIEITMTAGGSHTTTTRCHAFWRDGCGVSHISEQFDKTYLVPSTPVTACAVPPSVSRRGLSSEEPARYF